MSLYCDLFNVILFSNLLHIVSNIIKMNFQNLNYHYQLVHIMNCYFEIMNHKSVL